MSETHLAEVRELKEVGSGYTYFWSGRKSEEGVKQVLPLNKLKACRQALRTSKRYQCPPYDTGILYLGNKHAITISAYAPTMTNPDEVKDKLYAFFLFLFLF